MISSNISPKTERQRKKKKEIEEKIAKMTLKSAEILDKKENNVLINTKMKNHHMEIPDHKTEA